jgi:transcriptional regulator with XRE-family HTH domain
VLTSARLARACGPARPGPAGRRAVTPEEAAFLRVVGRRIRIHRLTRELTQEQLSDAAGISRSFISLIEKGRGDVSVLRLHRIAGVLDVPLTELLAPPPDPRAEPMIAVRSASAPAVSTSACLARDGLGRAALTRDQLGAAGGEDDPAVLGRAVAPLRPAIVTQHAATHVPSRPGGPA